MIDIHHEVIICLVCFYQDPQQLFQACKQGDLEMALKVLAADIDVDIKDIVRLVGVVELYFFHVKSVLACSISI